VILTKVVVYAKRFQTTIKGQGDTIISSGSLPALRLSVSRSIYNNRLTFIYYILKSILFA
jgi:hypothetical protein